VHHFIFVSFSSECSVSGALVLRFDNLREGFRACGMLNEQWQKIEKNICIA
jgi:hypothetical protein